MSRCFYRRIPFVVRDCDGHLIEWTHRAPGLVRHIRPSRKMLLSAQSILSLWRHFIFCEFSQYMVCLCGSMSVCPFVSVWVRCASARAGASQSAVPPGCAGLFWLL